MRFGQQGGAAPASSGADADGSGFVDATDLGWWKQNFGMVAAPGGGGISNVPEPGFGVMLFAVVGAMGARRRAWQLR